MAVGLVATTILLWPALPPEGTVADLLRGPDDSMRLVRVVDWIDGQAWHDPVQWRLNPPDGVAMHWSRFADMPVAAVVAVATPVLGRHRALHVAALTVPPLLGGVFVALFFWAAQALTERRDFPLALVTMVGALVMPLLQFRPGRIDHHGLQLVLVAAAAGFLFRCLHSRSARAAGAAGIAAAASLAVGLEMLPFAVASGGILSIAWIQRRDMAAPLAAYAAAMAAALLVFYPLTVPPAEWAVVACDRASLPHLAGSIGGAAAGATVWLAHRWTPMARRPLRAAVAAVAGGAVATALWAVFPQCAAGPYAELAPEIRYWFDRVSEARALADYFRDHPGAAVGQTLLPLTALAYMTLRVGAPLARRDRDEPQAARCAAQNAALFLLALTGAALLAWQVRNTAYAALVAAFALIPLAAAVNDRIDGVRTLLGRVGLRLCIPLICVGGVLLPPLVQTQLFRDDAEEERPDCEVTAVLSALTDPGGLGSAPRTIAAPIDLGPAILLRTPHRVLAAPYHRNVAGLVDHRLVFGGDEAVALDTIGRRKVDAVLFCSRHASNTAFPGEAGFLNERLSAGDPPPWLAPLVREAGIGLYRVDLAATAAPGGPASPAR